SAVNCWKKSSPYCGNVQKPGAGVAPVARASSVGANSCSQPYSSLFAMFGATGQTLYPRFNLLPLIAMSTGDGVPIRTLAVSTPFTAMTFDIGWRRAQL